MDWSFIQGAINVILAIAVFYYARKKETHDSSSQSTEVVVELRTLRRDVSELKVDVSAMRQEWRDDHDILVGVSREMAAMWKIIDRLQNKKKEEEA